MPCRPRSAVPTALGTILVLTVACRPAPGPPADDDTTAGTSDTTGPVATSVSAPDACQSSEDCEGEDLHCVAPYDPALDPPVGPGGCIQACIEADDLTRWCFDDAACCGELRCNDVDGLCESLTMATGDTTATDDGTTTGDTTATDDGTTTGDTTATTGDTESSVGTSTGTGTGTGTGTTGTGTTDTGTTGSSSSGGT